MSTKIENRRMHGDGRMFLYPQSQLFGYLDKFCRHLVCAAEARDFEIPGVCFEFREYEAGENPVRRVERIRTEDAEICFGRVQGEVPGTFCPDTAAAQRIVLEKKEIAFFDDGFLELTVFVDGEDRASERKSLRGEASAKPESSEGQNPAALRYWGKTRDDHFRIEPRPESDDGSAIVGPATYEIWETLEEFVSEMRERVYDRIVHTPLPAIPTDPFLSRERLGERT